MYDTRLDYAILCYAILHYTTLYHTILSSSPPAAELGGKIQNVSLRSSPYAGPSAGAEAACLRKWHVWFRGWQTGLDKRGSSKMFINPP